VARAFDIEGRVAVGEVDLAPLLRRPDWAQARAPSPFPPLDFDLSFLVGEDTPAATLLEATIGAGGSLVEEARVFDVFRGEGMDAGMKAVAMRYRLRAPDRTLESSELAKVREAMIEAAGEVGARLRGA
jgi:phenylalanyl-tRNA synthetase beta chain